MPKVILVTGATGSQGGAVINALLSSPHAEDFTILGLTRNPDGGGAQKLKNKGVKIVQGNLDDVPAVFEEAKKIVSEPIWGVYSVQIPTGKGATPETEEAQGKALVDGAIANDVKMFVYSSVDRGGEGKSFDNPTPVPHFISKHNVEHYLVEKAGANGEKMNWTILRPVAFMDNFTPDISGKGFGSMWKFLKDTPLQLVAVHDIGYFAAQAFLNPTSFNTRAISLAGDSLTFDQARDIWKKKTGNEMPTTWALLAKAMLWTIGDLGQMFKWFQTDGYGADLQMLRKEYPDLMDFGDWLVKESKFETISK